MLAELNARLAKTDRADDYRRIHGQVRAMPRRQRPDRETAHPRVTPDLLQRAPLWTSSQVLLIDRQPQSPITIKWGHSNLTDAARRVGVGPLKLDIPWPAGATKPRTLASAPGRGATLHPDPGRNTDHEVSVTALAI